MSCLICSHVLNINEWNASSFSKQAHSDICNTAFKCRSPPAPPFGIDWYSYKHLLTFKLHYPSEGRRHIRPNLFVLLK
ncbi:unnamed protein product [Rhizopus stolonifer]